MTTDKGFQVTFPQRMPSVLTKIARIQPVESSLAVITEITPFHPVDYTWPDQPADRGTLTLGNSTYNIDNCVTGAINCETNELFISQDIPVRKAETGWCFVVVHLLDNAQSIKQLQPGEDVELAIDTHYQQQLSLGHTACHLSAMALNRAATPFWRKSPGREDTLQSPDFDQMAIFSSQIQPGGSRDHYRIGKSIRKKGLLATDFMRDLPQLMAATEQQVNNWLALGSPITVRCDGTTLTDRRYWQCDLGEDGDAVIPCGGTHARHLQELGAVRITAEVLSETEFVMVTEVAPAQ